MDKHLFSLVEAATPKFNPQIVNGLAVQQMKSAENYVDRIFRAAASGFPEGLEYLGYKRCTPYEEYAEVAHKAAKGKTTLELSRSDVYMVKYLFRYFGEDLEPRFLYLPFVSTGGLITIRGSTFAISPILADRTISVGMDTIYIQMACGKLTFERQIHHFFRNNERDTVYVVSSQIHNHKEKRIKGQPQTRFRVGAAHTMMHYLFCKYGLTATFAQYANADVFVGYEDTINPTTYPPDTWYICRPTGLKPKGLRDRFYTASNILLAIRKDDYTQTAASMIGGFFYIVDYFPQRVEPEFVDEPRLWMVLLGAAIFGVGGSEGRLVEDIQDHMLSLDKYLNQEIREALLADDIMVEDIYDFFVNIIETMSQRVTLSAGSLSSMYGKKLLVLRFALFDINKAIFTFMFQLQSSAKKNINKNEILSLMRRILKPELIIGMTKKHREVNSVSCPGDNLFFKITSNLVPQTATSGSSHSKSKSNVTDPSKYLHASIADVGSYSNLPKSDPVGKSRVNPYLRLSDDFTVQRNPNTVELLDAAQRKFQR
jgi:hypothetical protein